MYKVTVPEPGDHLAVRSDLMFHQRGDEFKVLRTREKRGGGLMIFFQKVTEPGLADIFCWYIWSPYDFMFVGPPARGGGEAS